MSRAARRRRRLQNAAASPVNALRSEGVLPAKHRFAGPRTDCVALYILEAKAPADILGGGLRLLWICNNPGDCFGVLFDKGRHIGPGEKSRIRRGKIDLLFRYSLIYSIGPNDGRF